MSHFSNDAIVDGALFDAVDAVQNMSDADVRSQLRQRSMMKHAVCNIDIARDSLVDDIANKLIDDAMNMGGPHG